MNIQFFAPVPAPGPGPLCWDYEMTPCSAVPRMEDSIVLPVGQQRPGGGFDMQSFTVGLVEWLPSQGWVNVYLLPEEFDSAQGYDDDTAALVEAAEDALMCLRAMEVGHYDRPADALEKALQPFTSKLEP